MKPCQAALLHFCAFQGFRTPREANQQPRGEAKAHRDSTSLLGADTISSPSHAYEEISKPGLGDRLPPQSEWDGEVGSAPERSTSKPSTGYLEDTDPKGRRKKA